MRQLADFGADVIKIETRGEGGVENARLGSDFQNLQRNRRSLTLDLKHATGRDIFLRLAETADIVVENFRPDVKHRLRIDYETLRAINPRLIYASISGYGQHGPSGMRPGFDQIAQGMGGLMSITGAPGGGPMRVGIAVADSSAGLYCALGILTAVIERERSGQGQWVQTSLLEAQIAMLDFQATRWLMDRVVPQAVGNDHPTIVPMGVFPTQDTPVNIAAAGDVMFRKLCEALDAPALADDARYGTAANRARHRAALTEAIATITKAMPAAHWIARLNEAGVPCGPIYSIDQTFADPQVAALGIAQTVTHRDLGDITLVGQPVTLSRTPATIASAAPDLGEHTDAILAEAGFGADEVVAFRNDGIV